MNRKDYNESPIELIELIMYNRISNIRNHTIKECMKLRKGRLKWAMSKIIIAMKMKKSSINDYDIAMISRFTTTITPIVLSGNDRRQL